MDELIRKDVIARRLALAFTICCVASSGSAGDMEAKPAPQAPSMRGFLAQGWKSNAPLAPVGSAYKGDVDSGIRPLMSVVRQVSQASEDKERAPSILFKPDNFGSSVATTEPREPAASAMSLAELIRGDSDSRLIQEPALQPLVQEADAKQLYLAAIPESIESEARAETESADSIDSAAGGESLADLLRAHHDHVVKPIRDNAWSQSEPDPERCNQDDFVAPERRPLPTSVKLSASTLNSQLTVQSAPEITAEPTSGRQLDSADHNSRQQVASLKTNVSSENPRMQTSSKVPTFVSVPPRILRASDERPQPSPTRAESGEVEGAPEPSDIASSVPSEPTTASLAEAASLPILPTPVRDSDASPMTSDSLLAGDTFQREADEVDALMSIPSLENGEAFAPPIPIPLRTTSVTLHSTRLLELAQQLVLRSQQSLQRGATHTARKHAIEALQAVVAMRDAQDGGNVHSQQLERAFDAIRESKDFCGEFGSIDAPALGRMVVVHETTTLKQHDLSMITALEATEAYLDFAKEQLVLAAGGIREGSQALLLLGQVELKLANATDTHSTTVAVAVQRAAVEADPYFAIGYQVLGTTLLNLGLMEESAECVIASLRIQPTRMAYQRLLDIARRLGDVDTARACMKALEDPRMAEGDLVRNLTPQQFAATHHPVSTSIHQARSSSESETTRAQSEPAARIGFGSLFPFGRR